MSLERQIAAARASVQWQREWIEKHGGNVAAYVARYGDSYAVPADRFGDGGQLIYAADRAALRKAEDELHALLALRRVGSKPSCRVCGKPFNPAKSGRDDCCYRHRYDS